MRVLITNNTLTYRAGSELYVRDVALGLLARGHHPVAFSTVLGPIAEELRRATVPVIDDLGQLGDPPDVIHGHHHLETTLAALWFPDVPVLSFCHGWLPWEETPAFCPNVRRYVAVDVTCRDRLQAHGVAAEHIELLLNFVDLQRFKPGPPLPPAPRRALVFSNHATDASVEVVRTACQRHGLELDVVGAGAGTAVRAPEEILARYDVVFAKARAALEAMACGRAVILFDPGGAGPLVTSAGLDRLRPLNFGIRALAAAPTREHFERELGRYDADDAAEVAARVRSEAGLEATVDRLLELYARIIAMEPTPFSAQAVGRAAAAYLTRIAPRLKDHDASEGKKAELRRELDAARDRLDELARADALRRAERDEARQDAEALVQDGERLRARVSELEASLTTVAGEARAAAARARALEAEVTALYTSPAMRLRRGVVELPLVGRLARRLGKLVLGRNA